MARVLLLYSSVYGLSKAICERIALHLNEAGGGHAVQVHALTDPGVPLAASDVVLIGASIRHGKHNPTVAAFVQQHLALLQSRPSAFFSVNLVARKPHKNTPQTNPYLRRFMAATPWQPPLLGVFAGELDYSRYGPVDRQLMRLVMWINKGPTDPATRTQFTNWQEVARFARQLHDLAEGADAASRAASATATPHAEMAQPLAA